MPCALALIAGIPALGFPAAFLLFMILDNAHQVATLPLTLLDRDTMRRSGGFYAGGLAVLVVFGVLFSIDHETLAARSWRSLVIYWGAFHIIRQHYGFLRLYQARERPCDLRAETAEIWALYAGTAFPYLLNLSRGWAFQDGGLSFVRVPMPLCVAWIALAVFIATAVYACHCALAAPAAKQRGAAVRLLHIALAVSNFWIALLAIGKWNIFMATLFITSYHDVQYQAIVWMDGRSRFSRPAAGTANVTAPLFQFRSPLAYLLAIAVFGVILECLQGGYPLLRPLARRDPQFMSILFGAFSSYTYAHYLFDGKLWKRKERGQAFDGFGRLQTVNVKGLTP